MDRLDSIGRAVIVLFVAVLSAAAGWVLFVETPTTTVELVGILLVLATVAAGLRFGGSIASRAFPAYNAAEVAVSGPITRDGDGGFPPSSPTTPGADDIVELIQQADEDDNAEALVVRLNTPGGAVVPSDDIRLAAKQFDGPTVAYATDVCASGGYWIASGCDELWARHGSIVGSIGVRGSRLTAADLLDDVGLSYEQLTAGEFKEAGVPLKEMNDDERAYLQGIVDDYYDQFVETVADGREMDPEMIRETEARVYLGETAAEMGLVDEIGTRDAVEDRLEELLGEEPAIEELQPQQGITQRIRGGAEAVAYAAGAGVGRIVSEDGEFRLRV